MSKVLLVEDDNNLREIFEMRLKAEGYDTVTAGDGEEALVVAMREKPDLIIADVMMPKLSGFEMLETLRAAPEMAQTKVFMMTALGQAEDRSRGEKLGVVKYLVKSQVTLEDFVRVVREVLQPGLEAALQAAPAPAATTGSIANNNQESEHHMPEDNNPQSNPMPSTPPADDSAAPSVNPGSDSVADSGQMSTAEEKTNVDSQINDFVSSAPAGGSDASAAPASDSSSPFGGSSSTTEAPDVPVTSAPTTDDSASAETPPASPEGSGTDAPSAPSPSSGL